MELVQDTFRPFADNVVAPQAEHVHRTNGDVPRTSSGASPRSAPSGCRSRPSTAATARVASSEYLAMVVATEELSRASLGIGGSLITRPEILTRALVKGGTEEQKQEWLPKLATAEVMVAVAVTEPDYGSDVAGLKVTATPRRGRRRRRPATSSTASRRGARSPRAPTCSCCWRAPIPTAPWRTAASACSSCPSRAATGTASSSPRSRCSGQGRQDGGSPDRHDRLPRHAQLRGRPRGLVGAGRPTSSARTTGSGAASTYQMEGFENGRLQTAARAIGVMQAAYEEALEYARNRNGLRARHRRLPADPGQARADGGADPGRAPVHVPRRHADGEGPGRDGGVAWSRPTCARPPSG